MTDSVTHDFSAMEALDEHFADKRTQELNLEAEAQRAQHMATMAGLRNERIRKFGLVALPIGAGLGLALFGASFLIAPMPKINYREIDVPKVTMRDVTVPNIVQQEVPVDHVPHDVTVDRVVPRDVPGPITTVPPLPMAPPAVAEDVPKTPDEKKFEDKPAYQKAPYRGRIIHSVDGRVLSFADRLNLHPAHWDPIKSQVVEDIDQSFDSDPYVGDIGMCTIDEHKLWLCSAMHDGHEVTIGSKQNVTSLPPCPPSTSKNGLPILVPRCAPEHASSGGQTPAALDTINTEVDTGDIRLNAMVDTGCTWPMSIPSSVADDLLKNGLAMRTSPAKSTLADGSVRDTDVIVIKSIIVDGRVLQDVIAAVAPSQIAPILLGMGALNRLGPYNITNGRIVFTGDQPT